MRVKGFLFGKWDLNYGAVLFVQFLFSNAARPNAYINPTYCVLMWTVTVQILYWWYGDRVPKKPTFKQQLAEANADIMRLDATLVLYRETKSVKAYKRYKDVNEQYDLLLRFLLEQGYSDRDKPRPSERREIPLPSGAERDKETPLAESSN